MIKNYTLRLHKNGGKVETVRTKKRKRFLRILRTIKWGTGILRGYIKVSYGKKICVDGYLCEFYNDGYYDNKEDLLEVFKVFNEEE